MFGTHECQLRCELYWIFITYMFIIRRILTTGNFGVVYKAYYEKENIQIKVALKALKGK